MSIRIPGSVNRVLDTVGRRPRVAAAIVAGAALAWPLAVVWASPAAAVIAGCGLLLYIAGVWFTVRELRYREIIRQQAYDLAAAQQIIKRLSAGDPTAPTAQLRPIGDRGEIT